MNEVPIKLWWKSSTLWVNVLIVVLTVIVEVLPDVQQALGLTKPSLWMLILASFANVGLRMLKTNQPVTVAAALRQRIPDQLVVQYQSGYAIEVLAQDDYRRLPAPLKAQQRLDL